MERDKSQLNVVLWLEYPNKYFPREGWSCYHLKMSWPFWRNFEGRSLLNFGEGTKIGRSARSGGTITSLGPWSSRMTLMVPPGIASILVLRPVPPATEVPTAPKSWNLTVVSFLSFGEVPFLAEEAKNLAEVPNLMEGRPKDYQAPGPKSNAPCTAQNHVLGCQEIPRRQRDGISVYARQPSSSLIIYHVRNPPMAEIMLGGWKVIHEVYEHEAPSNLITFHIGNPPMV